MTRKAKNHKIALALAALLLAALLAALPVLAASPNVQAVLDQLATLQGADISPQWAPDIRANQQSVQQLLTLYQACTAGERAEFTQQQNDDLKAYFTALYEIQGKSAGEVDALFTGAAAPPASSSAPAASSSPAPGGQSDAASQPQSGPAGDDSADGQGESAPPQSESLSQSPPPASSSAPAAGGDGSASMPATTNTPQTPQGGGWQGLFGNRALGSVLLAVLLGLAAVIFVRFLLALRKAGRLPPEDAEEDLRAQELFGENQPLERTGLAEGERASADGTVLPPEETGPRSFVLGGLGRGKNAAQPYIDPMDELNKPKPPARETQAPEAREAESAFPNWQNAGAAQNSVFTPPAREGAPDMPDAQEAPGGFDFGGFGRAAEAAPPPANAPRAAAPPQEGRALAGKPLPRTGAAQEAPRPDAAQPQPAEPATPAEAAPDKNPPPARPARQRKKGEPPSIGANPDKSNPITMRSFGSQPRTGRPAKMTFRQGDPDDLDAIDE